MKNTNKQAGFTLVELAIVMVIIGLLIGGILKGQELIKNAAVSSTAAQLKAFESAYVTFLDIYNMKPGDFSEARNKINLCNSTSRCRNGNANGFIWHANSIQNGRLGQITNENRQALKHMALANLIGGVDPRAGGGNRNADGLVKSDLDGFLYIGESRGNLRGAWSGNTPIPSGILVGQTPLVNTWAANGGLGSTATVVARLDGKIDDGSARGGNMRATGNRGCFNGNDYRMNNDNQYCNFVYKIN